MSRTAWAVALLLGTASTLSAQASDAWLADSAAKVMRCSQSPAGMAPDNQPQLNCRYTLGPSLDFEVAGVGQRDAAVTFYHVDFEGDLYASFGIMHQCVIIKESARSVRRRGGALPDLAFVSVQNGKVFRTWQACAAG